MVVPRDCGDDPPAVALAAMENAVDDKMEAYAPAEHNCAEDRVHERYIRNHLSPEGVDAFGVVEDKQ